MSDGKKYYCFCSSNCKYETMTKEQILAAIAQATGVSNVDPNAGFITKVKEKNGGNYVTFWVGTQAQYNAIESKDTNCMYIITDDTTSAELIQLVERTGADCAAAETSAREAAAAAKQSATAAEQSAAAVTGIADYVVEQGEKKVWTSGIAHYECYIYWKYRKWSSGRVECWLTAHRTLNLGEAGLQDDWKAWGALYEATITVGLEYPFTISDPVEVANVTIDGAGAMVQTVGRTKENFTNGYFAVRPDKIASPVQANIDIYVSGMLPKT